MLKCYVLCYFELIKIEFISLKLINDLFYNEIKIS